MSESLFETLKTIIQARAPKWTWEIFFMFLLIGIGGAIVLHKTKLNVKQKLLAVVMYIYVANVLVITMLGREGYEISEHMRATFLPFLLREPGEMESMGKWALEFIFNMDLFLPLGLLLPFFQKGKNRYQNTIIIGFISTIVLEILQCVSKLGSLEIDDIVANALGTVIGASLHLGIKKLYILNKEDRK